MTSANLTLVKNTLLKDTIFKKYDLGYNLFLFVNK